MYIGDSDGAKYFHFTLTVILRLVKLCQKLFEYNRLVKEFKHNSGIMGRVFENSVMPA
jgi:hypothetical protein